MGGRGQRNGPCVVQEINESLSMLTDVTVHINSKDNNHNDTIHTYKLLTIFVNDSLFLTHINCTH